MSPPRPPPQRQPRTTTLLCVVWDLDETLILLDSLRSSSPEAGQELRRCVLDLAARRFHLDRLGGGAEEEEEEEEEGGDEDSGKRNSVIKLLAAEAASAYDSGPRCCLSAEASLEAARARAAVDAASGGWLRAASRLLAEMTSRSSSSPSPSSPSSSPAPCSPSSSSPFAFRHFLVTAAPLAPTLAKLMVCGLSGFFPSAAVRCCWKKERKRGNGEENGGGGVGGGRCRCRKAVEFEALQREVEREEEEDEERKGGERRRLLFLAVGNSLGDELAAEAAGWPFVRVGPRAVGKEFGNNGAADADTSADGDGTSSSSFLSSTKEKTRPPHPDALGRVSTPMTRLTLLDLMRAAGALGGG